MNIYKNNLLNYQAQLLPLQIPLQIFFLFNFTVSSPNKEKGLWILNSWFISGLLMYTYSFHATRTPLLSLKYLWINNFPQKVVHLLHADLRILHKIKHSENGIPPTEFNNTTIICILNYKLSLSIFH